MKKLVLFTLTLLASTLTMAQDIDRSKAPAAGPASKIQMGEYETFTLSNGLQVFVVENHKRPRVSWQLFVNHDVVSEGTHAGMQSLMGDLLGAGTTTRTKQEIDAEQDFIGASLSTSAYGAYASSLTKHHETILELMSDVVLHPTFPSSELDKLKKQTLSGLMANASDPGAISSNVGSILKYGANHPYGEIETKESVESIDSAMCREFYNTYFKPNVSYMIVVGDIKSKDAQTLLEKYFGGWERGDVPKHTYEVAPAPASTHVAFVDKPGAVQSTINIVYPVNLKPGQEDIMAAKVMNAILGSSGFMARLIQNIREDKAYTYGAYSSLSSDELVGSFYAGAEVRNEVTDSAIVQFLYEMNRMTTEMVGAEELQNVKNYLNGQFSRGMESPQMVARFALNTARYNLPADYYETYLERLDAVTAEDVMAAAKKYLTPDNAYILVVGNKSEVANKLKVFSKENKVNYYDAYGNPVADVEPIPAGVTSAQVIENYLKAIGGREVLEGVKTQDVTLAGSMQGRPLAIHTVSSGDSKYAMTVQSGTMVLQSVVVNGSKGKMTSMMGSKDLSAEEVASYLGNTAVADELTMDTAKAKLIHIEEFNGVRAYKMEVSNEDGSKSTYFYAVESGLKLGEMESQDTPQGPMVSTTTYSDYKEVDGIMIPFSVQEDAMGQTMEFKVENAAFGKKVDESNFKL